MIKVVNFCFISLIIHKQIGIQTRRRVKCPHTINIYDFLPKGVHENRTKGVENKVDDTLKLVVFLECAQC